MINFHFAAFAKMVVAFFLALSQSPATTAHGHVATLSMGDEIDGMTLTSGVKDAPPIWAFCSMQESSNGIAANCRVPQMPALAIGHVFLPGDRALSELKWTEWKGELYIDQKLINLNGFNSYNYVSEVIGHDLSPVREVYVESIAWDVVLADLQPGEHIIEGRVQTGSAEYRWTINLVIEAKPSPFWMPLPKHDGGKEIRSGCSLNGTGLSRFHRGCRLYG